MRNFLINLIFPSRCLNCKTYTEHGAAICRACESNIPLNHALFCGKCGARLPAAAPARVQRAGGSTKAGLPKKICHKDFPYLLGSATDYNNEAVRNLVHGLKFRFIRSASEPLGRLLARYTEELALPLRGYTTIPIPLSPARFRERGFNQSELVSKIFADHFKLPLDTKSLIRIKHAKPQSETRNIVERQENVKKCFAVKHPESLRGTNVVLIDDVTTSGTTLLEAAMALKSAGVKKIIALTAAKA